MVAAHAKAETVAARKASQLALEAFTAALPELLGGSADLTGSNLTNTKHTPPLRFDAGRRRRRQDTEGRRGRHINYGVREFGMAAIMNGIALHGGFIPYGGTFLTFSDYSRNAIRMAALMKQRVIHVFTHDSIGLGEDGPTHQSIEHAAVAAPDPEPRRLAPGRHGRDRGRLGRRRCENADRPTALLLSRQNLPYAPKNGPRATSARGAYVLAEPAEVGLKKQGAGRHHRHRLRSAARAEGAGAAGREEASRCASSPCLDHHLRPPGARPTRRACCPHGVPRIAVEMGVTDGWWKYGCAAVVGIDTLRRVGAGAACCSSTSASRPRTSPPRSKQRSSAESKKHTQFSTIQEQST